MGRIRILSLNINAGFDVSRRRFILPELRDAVLAADADIVLLQEVLGRHAGHAHRQPAWPSQPQHEYLAQGSWSHHVYGRNAVFDEGDQGNALLSRFEILEHENRDVSIPGHEPRGVQWGVLRLPGEDRPLHVINVHLGLRESHRARQIALLCRIVTQEIPREAAVVVAGDFNDWLRRGHAALLSAGLFEAFEQSHGRLARTFPAGRPMLALDRIYLRNVRAWSPAVLTVRPWRQLSDHAPLLAEIELLPGR